MFTSTHVGDFTLYLTDTNGIVGYIDPFHYHLQITFDDDGLPKSGKSICNNIPCQMCQFQPDCKDGVNRTPTLFNWAKANFPELLI